MKKFIHFKNILHTSDICGKLISADLQKRARVRIILDSGTSILTNAGEFVGTEFCKERLFVLDLVPKNNMNASFAYIVKSISLWHARLGHVNITSTEKACLL